MQAMIRAIAIVAIAASGVACADTEQPARAEAPVVPDTPVAAIPQADTTAPLTAAEVQHAQQLEVEERPAMDATPAPPRPAGARRRVVLAGLDLTDIGYDKGDPDAPIVLVNFSDFGCPYCASFGLETFPELERDYVATGKVYYKHVPFVMGMFPNGQQAARASECAADQGKFWEMHDRIYAGQRTWKQARDPFPTLAGMAVSAGLDTTAFRRCFNDHRTEPRTRRASNAADDLGVRATPTFAVNGRAIEGALPLAEFRRILDAMNEARE